ncbi:transposase [Oceanispirochaeta crateris]|uniref:transposase n=1 Tax=Oceanispirochaeta crateris TaxID=2518645 RepID=UPI003CCC6F5C
MKRKSYDKKFKAKVALEAIRGEKSLQELAQLYGIHANQISLWKKHLLDGVEDIFERPNKKKTNISESELKESELYKNIVQLQVENQFLKKRTRNCTGTIRIDRTG